MCANARSFGRLLYLRGQSNPMAQRFAPELGSSEHVRSVFTDDGNRSILALLGSDVSCVQCLSPHHHVLAKRGLGAISVGAPYVATIVPEYFPVLHIVPLVFEVDGANIASICIGVLCDNARKSHVREIKLEIVY